MQREHEPKKVSAIAFAMGARRNQEIATRMRSITRALFSKRVSTMRHQTHDLWPVSLVISVSHEVSRARARAYCGHNAYNSVAE